MEQDRTKSYPNPCQVLKKNLKLVPQDVTVPKKNTPIATPIGECVPTATEGGEKGLL